MAAEHLSINPAIQDTGTERDAGPIGSTDPHDVGGFKDPLAVPLEADAYGLFLAMEDRLNWIKGVVEQVAVAAESDCSVAYTQHATDLVLRLVQQVEFIEELRMAHWRQGKD